MRIVFTGHAKQRMLKREIPKEWIKETLENPTAVSKGGENKKIAFRGFGGKVVEVVFAEEQEKFVVVSVRWR